MPGCDEALYFEKFRHPGRDGLLISRRVYMMIVTTSGLKSDLADDVFSMHDIIWHHNPEKPNFNLVSGI